MAIAPAMQWWIRQSGNVANGGGFDATVAGAGTNYADQDAPQVTFSAGNANRLNAVQSSTTVTSDATPFTSAMVGNVIRIDGGTNFVTGYYVVTTFTSSTTITVDRAPATAGAGSLGTGRLGGAWDSIQNAASTANAPKTAPAIATPVVAGNQINKRGAGSDEPTAVDYNYNDAGYWTFPAGDTTNGLIRLVGYNGRPRIDVGGLWHFNSSGWHVENVKVVAAAGNNPSFGFVINGPATARNVVADQAGFDVSAIGSCLGAVDCLFDNTGGTTAGTQDCLAMTSYFGAVLGSVFRNWRGPVLSTSNGAFLAHNLFISVRATSYVITFTAFPIHVLNNSYYDCRGDGVRIASAATAQDTVVRNNLFVNGATFGINYNFGSVAANDRIVRFPPDYNAFFNNTSGARNNISAGANDVTLTGTPYVDAAAGNLKLNDTAGAGLAAKAAGFPGAFRGLPATVGYVDLGAVQRIESAGGAAAVPFVTTLGARRWRTT